jgi:hypothetical protein
MSRIAIRNIVKDIVDLLKKEEEGRFDLPNSGDDYNFSNLSFPISVDLVLLKNNDIRKYKIESDYVPYESIINLVIEYNKTNLVSNLYDLIGEINEIIAHELEHARQDYFDEFEFDEFEFKGNNLDYYLQPHEILAQIKGFKRLSKLSGLPFFIVVRNWFNNHKEIHGLTPMEVEVVINKLLQKNGNL